MMLCIYDPDDHRDELEGMIEELGGWVMAFGEDLMRKNTECWNLKLPQFCWIPWVVTG